MDAKFLPKTLLCTLLAVASALAFTGFDLDISSPGIVFPDEDMLHGTAIVPQGDVLWTNGYVKTQLVQNICTYWIYVDDNERQKQDIGGCWTGEVLASQRIDTAGLAPGLHSVKFRVSGLFWYDNSITRYFYVNGAPSFNITHSGSQVGRVDFSVDGNDDGIITEYAWDFNNDKAYDQFTTKPNTFHYFDTPGLHTVNVRAKDNYGLTATFSDSFTLNDIQRPVSESPTMFDIKFSARHAYYNGYAFRTYANSVAFFDIITKSSSDSDPIIRFDLTSDKSIQTHHNFTYDYVTNMINYNIFATFPKICKSIGNDDSYWTTDGITNEMCPPDNSYILSEANDGGQVAALNDLVLGTRPYTVVNNISVYLEAIEVTANGNSNTYKATFRLGGSNGFRVYTTANTSSTAPSVTNPIRTRLQFTNVNGHVLDCFVHIESMTEIRIGNPGPVAVGDTSGMTCNLDASILYKPNERHYALHENVPVNGQDPSITLLGTGQETTAKGTFLFANIRVARDPGFGNKEETHKIRQGEYYDYFASTENPATRIYVDYVDLSASQAHIRLALAGATNIENHTLTITATTKSGKKYSIKKTFSIDWYGPTAKLSDFVYTPDPVAIARSDAIRKAAWERKIQKMEKDGQ